VTGLELLREVRRHECSASLRVGSEVSLARLTPRGGNGRRVLHIFRSDDSRIASTKAREPADEMGGKSGSK
jgi:hypothetical protein